jgi:hypothetical protein
MRMLTRYDLYKYIEIKETLDELPAQANAFARQVIDWTNKPMKEIVVGLEALKVLLNRLD